MTVLSTRTPQDIIDSLDNPLFLGEWCSPDEDHIANSRSQGTLGVPIFPHPWSSAADRENAIRDFNSHYDSVLPRIAKELNKAHCLQNSDRYWEILIGPWLRTYGFVAFEKFTLLMHLSEQYGDELRVLQKSGACPPVQDTHEFKDVYTRDEFMSSVTAEIANLLQIKSSVREDLFSAEQQEDKLSTPQRKSLIGMIPSILSRVFRPLVRETDAVLFQTFQTPFQDLLWSVKLGQIPFAWTFPRVPIYEGKLDRDFRGGSVSKGGSSFGLIFEVLAKRNLPICFLENFARSCDFVSSLQLPKRPKWIFTSNAYFKFESFKIYAAQQAETGTPLLIGQHGGGFGTARENSHERHVRKIADGFFTWGWDDGGNSIPSSIVKPLINLRPRKSGYFLLIQFVAPDFFHEPSTMPLGKSNWLDYWDDQMSFYGALPKELQSKVRVRPYPGASASNQMRMWRDNFPDVKFDRQGSSLRGSLSRASLAIITYESTTYLQCLNASFPIVCFWRTDHWPMRESAKREFDVIEQSDIFTEDPLKAAHILRRFEASQEEYDRNYRGVLQSKFSGEFAARFPSISTSVKTFIKSRT